MGKVRFSAASSGQSSARVHPLVAEQTRGAAFLVMLPKASAKESPAYLNLRIKGRSKPGEQTRKEVRLSKRRDRFHTHLHP